MGILLEEWMAFYEKATDGKVAELEPLPVQYADFAQWQKGWLKEDVLDQQLQYWRKNCLGASCTPTSYGSPASRDTNSSRVDIHSGSAKHAT